MTEDRADSHGHESGSADLVVLSAPPAEVRGELDADLVAATLIAGEMVYERG